MNGDPQKRKVLYEALTKDGYALGTLEEFSSKMDMPDKAKALYDGITKDGYDVGDFETFSAKVGPPKTQALPSMTTPLPGAAAGPATSSATPAAPLPTSSQAAVMQFDAALQQPMPADFSQRGTDPLASHPSTPEIPEKLDPLNQKRAELFRGYTSIRNKERAAREEHSTMLANQRNYRDMGMAGGADELNKKLGFASDQASMYGDIKKQHTDYFNEQLDRSVGEEVDKDVNSLTMDRQGLLVADPAKVREKAERFAAKYGLAKDQEFVKDVQNRMDSRVQAGVLKPRVDKLFDEEKKKIISEEGDKVWRGFTTDSVEYAHATETISDLQKQASAGAKADADAIYARTSAAAEAITEQWKSQEAETLKAADAVKAQFDAGKLDASTANQLLDRVNQKYQSGYAQYSGAVKAEQDAYITDLNKVNSRYNERFAEQQKAILKDANARVQEAAAKYLKEYEGSPEAEATRQKLNAAYEKAWKTAAQERGKAEGVAANVRYNLASSALGPIAAMGGRFMESTVAGLGGVFKGMATTVGSDGGYVLGQEMERAFLLPEARSKEFADLIDPANISQLSGQLVGGMAPSIVAAAGVSAATGGSGAPIAAQLVASSLAAWGAETLDISGRMKDDVFRDTRDMDKANDAAWKSFRSQVQLLPTYAFEGLPFVKGFLKAVPTRALRAGTGAAIEYGTEVLQEVPQNIAEKNIRAGKDPWEGFTEELDRQSKSGELRSTLIGMAPITLLGGAGQITESSGKQDMLNAAKSYAAKAKIDQISASGGQQWMNGMVKARGEKFARAVISSMYTGGSIDEATAKKFIGFVDENRAINSEAKALNIPGVHHDAYVAFSADYADLSAKAEAETSPLAKAVLTQRANEAKKAATEIAAGNGEYVTVKYPDGTTTVLAPSQAAKLFADEEFLSTAAITSFGNNGLTFTANGKEAMTMLGDFQERSMERLEEIKQGKREFLADAKADREAKAPKAAPVTTAAPSLPASPSINITPPPTTTGGATAPTATASEPTAKKEQKPTASKALEAVGLTEIPEAAPTSDEEGGGAVTPEAATGFQEAVDASKQSRSPNEVSEWVLTNSRVGDTYTDNIGNGYEVVRVKTRKDGKREVELQQFEILPDGTKDVNNAGVLLLVDGLPNRASNLLGYSYIDKDGNRQTSDYKLTRNEGSTTTSEASAVPQAENTGAAPGVPLEQPTAAEPVANSIDRHETRNKQYIVERGEDGQVRVTQAPGYKPRPLPPMPDADAPSAVIRQWKREKNKVDDAERQARRTALIEYEKEYGVDTGRGHKTPIQKWNESVADVNGRMNKMSDQNKDPRLYALSFLLNGGKINFAAAKKELGSNARTDLDKLKKNGILVDDPNAKSVQGVADALAESMAEQLGTDVGTAAELRTALIDALGHNSRSGVLKAMTDIMDKMPKVKDVASGDTMAAMTPEDWDDVNAVEEARNAFIEYVQKTGGDVDLANAWFDDEVGKNQRASFDYETPERQQQLIETAEQALSQLPPDGTEAETRTPDAAPGEVDAGKDAGGLEEVPSGTDPEAQRLQDEVDAAKAELAAAERSFKKRAESLFDAGAVQTRKEAQAKKAPEPGMFEAEGDTRANSASDFDKAMQPLRDRVALAEKALADYDAQGGARAQAAAQQTSIDQAAADNIPVSKPEKAMSSASRFRPRKRVEFDTPIKGPSGAVLKAYEWQYEFEEYIDDRGEERVRRVSDWNKAELSDETGRDIVHQFEVVTPDGLGYLVSAESALKLMGYMEANASVKSKMSAAKALAGLLMQRQVLQEEVARRKAVEDEVDALKRPEITEEDKSENEELRGFGREESKNRINQIWRMGDASIWASFKKDDPFLNSEKEERTKTLVRSWKDNRLKERGVKSYENPSAKLREVEKKIATKERQLGAKATDVTQAPAQAEAPLPKNITTYRPEKPGGIVAAADAVDEAAAKEARAQQAVHDNLLQKGGYEKNKARIKEAIRLGEQAAKKAFVVDVRIDDSRDVLGKEKAGKTGSISFSSGGKYFSNDLVYDLFFDVVNGRYQPNELAKSLGVRNSNNSYSLPADPAKANEVAQALADAGFNVRIVDNTIAGIEPQIGSAEAAARKAAAALDRAKLKPDQLYALPLPPSVWNGAIRAMQEVIIAGGKAVDAIAAAIKHIQASDWWKNKATQKEKDEVVGHLKNKQDALEAAIEAEAKAEEPAQAPPPATPKAAKEHSDPKEVKKTFATVRAYEGEFRKEVKEELKKGGLTRKVENQVEAKERADAIIAKVGIDAALAAAKAGDVRGGARSAIIFRALEDIKRKMDAPGRTQDEMDELAVEQSDLLQWQSQELTEAGQESSMMGLLYEESDLGFTVAARTADWKKKTGEEPTENQIKRWKEVEAEMNLWKERWADAEKRAQEAEAAATMKAIQDSVARQRSINRKTTPAQRSKVLADKIRTLKIGQRGVMSATIVPPQLWDAAVEAVAQTVQAGGNLATAIQAGLKKLRESDWYKKLQQAEQQDSEASFSSAVEDAMADDVESGPIRIPKQMIREAVANGAKDIDTLVATIKEQIKDQYPDATDREIRDAITEYGKVVNLNKDELSQEVRRIKRIGRIVSALEDVANKKRPLRSGLQRDKMDAEERALNKELREAMKDLPVDAEAQARELRTALDAAKTRARNRIEDLQREIDTKQRAPKSERTRQTDAELDALIAERDELQAIHDDVFGEKPMTPGERKIASLQNQLDRIRQRDFPEAKESPQYTKEDLAKMKSLRDEIQEARAKAGLIASKELPKSPLEIEIEGKIKAKEKAILDLTERLSRDDLSPKPKAKGNTSYELEQLRAEHEKLTQELKDRRKAQEVKMTPQERSVKRLQDQLDDLLAGRLKDKERIVREKSQEEKDLADAIAKQKALMGMTQPVRTKEESRLIAIENAIEETKRRIRDLDLSPKKADAIETEAIRQQQQRLSEVRDDLKKLQEEAGVIDRRRLDAAKKAAKTRIQELERRIEQGDFSKKEAKPPVVDNELIRLQAEKMRLKEEYDKEFYKNRLLNRTMPERVKDSLWEAWGLTRALRATGELSFVLMQGGALTVSNLWHKPGAVGRAFKTMWQAMRSEKKSEEWLRKVKAQDWYPIAKEAKLAITEPHAGSDVGEELFMSDWTKIIWNVLGSPLKLKSKEAYKAWTKANPARVIERGASAYLDTLRIERFMDGLAMLEKNTGTPPTKQDYKDIADVVNTLTYRATIGKLEPIGSTLTKMFFSPRLWAAAIKTATPYGLHHFGLFPIYTKNAETGKWGFQNSKGITPTARKLAVQDLGRFIGTTMGFVALAAAYFNNDDDDETGVETDPRSADFGKIKIGNKYIDPWGGRIQQLVFATRMTIGALSLLRDKPFDAYKDRKTGAVTPLGQGMTPTMAETAIRMAQNKLAPSAGLLWEAASTKLKKDGTRTSFGKPYDMSEEMVSNLYPIYVETVADLAKEDPGALEGFLAFYAFFGGGVNVDATASPSVESPEDAKKRIEAMSAAYK